MERAVMYPVRRQFELLGRPTFTNIEAQSWNPTDPDDPYWPEACARVAEKPKTKAGLRVFWELHPELRGAS